MPDRNAPLYDASGTELGEVSLDPHMFGMEPNRTVMHQVVVAHMAGRRAGNAKVKSRSEVRGGGRKPWRQKGLGRARHGSIRSPLWVGGGSAHGPKPRSFAQRTPKKMRNLALRSALSSRAAEGAVKVIDQFEWDVPKTKRAQELLTALGVDGKALVVLDAGEDTAALSFNNLPQVVLSSAGSLNTYDVLWSDTVVFSTTALSQAGSSQTTPPEGPSAPAEAKESAPDPVEAEPTEDESPAEPASDAGDEAEVDEATAAEADEAPEATTEQAPEAEDEPGEEK